MLFQENYKLKKKIEVLEKVNEHMENELSFIMGTQGQEKSKYCDLEAGLNSASAKVSVNTTCFFKSAFVNH